MLILVGHGSMILAYPSQSQCIFTPDISAEGSLVDLFREAFPTVGFINISVGSHVRGQAPKQVSSHPIGYCDLMGIDHKFLHKIKSHIPLSSDVINRCG